MRKLRYLWDGGKVLVLSLGVISPINATVESVFFSTKEVLPVFEPPPSMSREYALFQASLPYLAEGIVVLTVISFGNQATDLSAEKQQSLLTEFKDVYRAISLDEAMRGIPHTLAYSYTSVTPTRGHYYACIPDEINEETRSIVFLHGFGGNFLYYTWLLKSEYPDAIILLPTYTYSWFDGSLSYVEEVITNFEGRHNLQLKHPWLFALSAGGPAGFRIYNEAPEKFTGLVCLASGPLGLTAKDFHPDLNIYMLNGNRDDRIDIEDIRELVGEFQDQLPSLRYQELPSDHFFMLTEREECFELVNDYMEQVENKR